MHGSSYEAFMKSKLIPVIGDIGEENLGIDVETADKISDEIDVKINSAGRTTLTTGVSSCSTRFLMLTLTTKLKQIRRCPKCQCSWP